MIETNWSRDGLRLKSHNLRRGCRLQDRGAVQGRSESGWRVVAHRRGEREARLARGGIREHDAFLRHEMRGPAGTGRGGVLMSGGREGQGTRKGNGVKRLRQWCVVAHRRGEREARLARGGKKKKKLVYWNPNGRSSMISCIREHDAFLGHEMRGPAGTGRGGVSMAGGREGQGARKGNGVRVHRLPSPPCFVQILLKYFGFLSR